LFWINSLTKTIDRSKKLGLTIHQTPRSTGGKSMLKPRAVVWLIALAVSSLLSLPVGAQLNTGTILGTVTDATGAVVPGANVEVQNQDTGLVQTATSNSVGEYVVPSLAIGRYRVTVSLHGFKRRVIENLTLRVSDRLRVDAGLETGQLSEKVTVTGETPLVDTASTTLGGVVNSQQVHDLPLNGRSVTELIGLVPGVMLRGGANQQSVGGQGTFTNTGGLHFLVDGGDASRIDFEDLNNTYGASQGRISRASVDSIEEFRVYTDSYSAEFGQTQGGVINLVTKSGTNELHGSLFEYFRNEKLDARDYFNAAPPTSPLTGSINLVERSPGPSSVISCSTSPITKAFARELEIYSSHLCRPRHFATPWRRRYAMPFQSYRCRTREFRITIRALESTTKQSPIPWMKTPA
jgi:hypothetical protein